MYNTDDVDLDFPEGNEVDVTQLGLNAVWHFDSYKVISFDMHDMSIFGSNTNYADHFVDLVVRLWF